MARMSTAHTTTQAHRTYAGVYQLIETATGQILDEGSASCMETGANRYEWTYAMEHTSTAAAMDAQYRAAIAR